MSVHPMAIFTGLHEDHRQRMIFVFITPESSRSDLEAVQETTDKLRLPYKTKVMRKDGKEMRLDPPKDEIFSIGPSRSKKSLKLPFIEREEQFWFEKMGQIYSGNLDKADLHFYDENLKSCLVDCSVFDSVNLRNHLLLYDRIYLIPPLADRMDDFLNNQKISKDDILELVSFGRLVCVNIQPEERVDTELLGEIYHLNPNAIVSRRGIACLCALDLVKLNDSYFFNDPVVEEIIVGKFNKLNNINQINVDRLRDVLYWPKKALRASFEDLNSSGPMAMSRFGVNEVVKGIFPNDLRNATDFELTMCSPQVHMAHAFDATLYPNESISGNYNNYLYTWVMGNQLNFYKSFNFEYMTFNSKDEIPDRSTPSMDLVSVFEVNEYLPVSEFLTVLKDTNIRAGLRSLFSELSSLEGDARTLQISKYNNELQNFTAELNRVSDRTRYLRDFGLDLLGSQIPMLTTIKNICMLGGEPLLEYIHQKMPLKDKRQERLSLLSRISRVARLQRRHS